MKISLLKFAAVCAVAFALAATAPLPAFVRDQSGSLQIGGVTRTYLVHIPRMPPPPGGYPVILAFHGGGMQGKQMQRLTGLDREADEKAFITVYPDGIGKHWNDGRSTISNPQDDVGFVSALIDRLRHEQRINPSRIFATGISNGALFTHRLACDLSAKIAGIAPVAGTMPVELAPRCRPDRPILVMQISGTADPIMPFKGGAVSDMGGAGEGGQVLSVRDSTAYWARADRCARSSPPKELPPQSVRDRTRISRISYMGCERSGQVVLLTVEGGGHAWPSGPQFGPRFIIGLASQQINASRAIADFFMKKLASFDLAGARHIS